MILTASTFSTDRVTPASICAFFTYRPMNYGEGNNDQNLLKLFGRLSFDQPINCSSTLNRSLSFHVSGRWIDGGQ